MRRTVTAVVSVASLGALCVAASTRAADRGLPQAFARKPVEAALHRTGLTVLPDLAQKLPPGEIMDYGFLGEKGAPVQSAVIIYVTAGRARRASVAYQHGFVTKQIVAPPTRTLRVRNVLLLLGQSATKAQSQVLTAALARLGPPVSPWAGTRARPARVFRNVP